MEGLKDLEDQQRVFFELGAKISLIEEKEKSSNVRISELELEQEKNKKNLADLSDDGGAVETTSAESDVEKVIESEVSIEIKKFQGKVDESVFEILKVLSLSL